MSSRFAVRIATVMLTTSGIAARREASPTSNNAPHPSSDRATRTALKCGAGIPNSVKNPVTLPRSWSFPQPDGMKTAASDARTSNSASHSDLRASPDRRSRVERARSNSRIVRLRWKFEGQGIVFPDGKALHSMRFLVRTRYVAGTGTGARGGISGGPDARDRRKPVV